MYFRKSYTANGWKNRIDHTSDIMELHDMLGKKCTQVAISMFDY
jgi:hypothetical protein